MLRFDERWAIYFRITRSAICQGFYRKLNDALLILRITLAALGTMRNESTCQSTPQSRCRLKRQKGDPRSLRLEGRSEEHTSELQSQSNLVCRLLLEKTNAATS